MEEGIKSGRVLFHASLQINEGSLIFIHSNSERLDTTYMVSMDQSCSEMELIYSKIKDEIV